MGISVDHVGVSVSDFEKSKAFYLAALAPLGIKLMDDYGTIIGMGDDFPFFWLSVGDPGHVHLALQASDRAMVDAFFEAAIAAGGTDNGKPGIRADYSPNYYAAFVLDPDGHNIEVVCHVPG